MTETTPPAEPAASDDLSSDPATAATEPAASADLSSDPAIAAADSCISEQAIDKSASNWKTTVSKPPTFSFDPDSTYFWNLETSEGPIKIRLMPDVAPAHVSSTIFLVRQGFYDDVAFHRVIPGFMAQGGDPLGNGTGGPGYKYAGEFNPNVVHDRAGLLSMANAGPGTDGSQFFLTFTATPHLNNKHTIFGEVVEGMDTLKKLESFGTSPSGRTSKPLSMGTSTITIE